eukprot:2964174-Ditylum_brightwellii.AAC.1
MGIKEVFFNLSCPLTPAPLSRRLHANRVSQQELKEFFNWKKAQELSGTPPEDSESLSIDPLELISKFEEEDYYLDSIVKLMAIALSMFITL